MRVTNDRPGEESAGAFAELLRMQTDFQARLADETFRYLRRLHGTLGPGSPGTVVSPRDGLALEGRALQGSGSQVELALEIENVQRVHCIVSPQLTPLVGRRGTTWFPATVPPHQTVLVPPNHSQRLVVRVDVPSELPADEYGGALLLQGFRDGAIAVRIHVGESVPAASRRPATATPSRRPPRPKRRKGT